MPQNISASSTCTKYLSDGLLDLIMTQKNDRLNPIVQILNTKVLGPRKIRGLITDGKSCVSNCMFASEQIDREFSDGRLVNFTVICLEQYEVASLAESANFPVLLIRELTILKSGLDVGRKLDSGERFFILNPNTASQRVVSLNLTPLQQEASHLTRPLPQHSPQALPTRNINNGCSLMRQILVGINLNPDYYMPDDCDDDDYDDAIHVYRGNFFPINVLTPFTWSWTIRARVIRKSSIRNYQNDKGSGKLFDFEVKDETGHIDIVAFNEDCDRFFSQIEKHRVYFISKGFIRISNRRYHINEYQITLNSESVIRPCYETLRNIPKLPSFKFVQLSQLDSMQNGALVDVIGVIRSISPLQTKITRKTLKEVTSREVYIVDKSLNEVSFTLWNEMANEFKGESGQIVAIRGAALTEFQGKKLSAYGSTFVEINPQIPEASPLGLWYRHEGSRQIFIPLSRGPDLDLQFAYIGQITLRTVQNTEGAKYYRITAIVKELKSMDHHFYKSCGFNGCSKKVFDENNNQQYFCAKCNRTSSDYKWRLKLDLLVGDVTGSVWIPVFGHQAEKLFSKSEIELVSMFQNNFNQYERTVHSILLRQFHLRLRASASQFNNQTRLNLTLVGVNSAQQSTDRSKCLMKMIDVVQRQLTTST